MCIYSAISRAGAKEEKVTHLPISNIKLGPNRPGKQTSAHWSCRCGTFWQIPALPSPSCSRSLGHLCPSPLPPILPLLPLLPSSSAVCQFQGVPKESRSRAKRREEEERRKRKRRSRKKERREDERGRGGTKNLLGSAGAGVGSCPSPSCSACSRAESPSPPSFQFFCVVLRIQLFTSSSPWIYHVPGTYSIHPQNEKRTLPGLSAIISL